MLPPKALWHSPDASIGPPQRDGTAPSLEPLGGRRIARGLGQEAGRSRSCGAADGTGMRA